MKPAKTPDLERHDEVYFRGDAGPMCGKVLSRGAHGAIIDVEGKRHKMHWERYLGHKVRVRPDVKVVSQGEDGLLVEGPAGDRRFVRDDLGTKPMAKSLMPAVLFFAGATAVTEAIRPKRSSRVPRVRRKPS